MRSVLLAAPLLALAGDWWPRLAVREGDWKLYLDPADQRAELYNPVADRAEADDLATAHPSIVARLTRLALEWQATLPTAPDPACVSASPAAPGEARANKRMRGKTAPAPDVSDRDRARAFARWDTNQDGVLILAEYQAGLGDEPNLEKRFKSFDKDGDGRLTRDEFVGP